MCGWTSSRTSIVTPRAGSTRRFDHPSKALRADIQDHLAAPKEPAMNTARPAADTDERREAELLDANRTRGLTNAETHELVDTRRRMRRARVARCA